MLASNDRARRPNYPSEEEHAVIQIHNLVKRYGDQAAVDHLDLTIEQGQVCGLLGLNGAGKTTTMNMITGYLAPTEGQIVINGHDILEDPEQAKRCVGYLPDQPPLYLDMTVSEYLHFCAQLKLLPKQQRAAQIQKAMELTALTEVSGRLIKNLSKGYRQRVGLAQAILGSPDIIILDEPTDGLDPRQINEMLELIRQLGREHTVILSSHKLSEVQVACDRIVILHQGKKVADGLAEELENQLSGNTKLTLTARGERAAVERILSGVDGLTNLSLSDKEGEVTAQMEYAPGTDPREDLFFAFAAAGVPLVELNVTTASLEQVFLSLTQDEAGTADQTDSPESAAPEESLPSQTEVPEVPEEPDLSPVQDAEASGEEASES